MAIDTETSPEPMAVPGWDYTVEDYVRIEAESELVKHEFDNGQIRAMGGGTIEHARLSGAVIAALGSQLRGKPCAVYTADLRVRIAGLITYPDVSIGCGKSYVDLEDRHAQLNPCVLVEITSKSSERYDRGAKRLRYFGIPSLREYVIVSHRERSIDVFARDSAGAWTDAVTYGAGARGLIPSLGIELDVDDLYVDPRPDADDDLTD
jgi:Uma2 family endonuclease